ncbi:MAG: hypothetical protein IPM69_02440 [Ignavibacteria bacterium]|nr:hypothetical protein [Ignavibacteria bacterium]
MRTLFKLSILVVCVVFIGSCSAKNDTLVAVRDGAVLTEGTPVRFQLKSIFPSPFLKYNRGFCGIQLVFPPLGRPWVSAGAMLST